MSPRILADRPDSPPLGLMAVGSAVCVASIYLSQPILNLLAGTLHASTRQMGAVITLTQVGFGAGIVFLVPLGDVIAKKRLILAKLFLAAAALAVTGLSSTVGEMAAGSLAIGLFASGAQDFVPLAAELSEPQSRGHAVGTVMGGLLLGILGSRILSGALAQWVGWRASFFATALLALAVAALVWQRVPSVEPEHQSSYPLLLRSMLSLVRDQPLLVLSTIGHGFAGLIFSAFWTVLSFHLGGTLFHLSPSQIGAFALAGFAGAAGAPFAGRLADRRGPLFNIRAGIGLIALAFVSLLAFPASLAAMIAAAVVFDLGVQVSMVSHQAIIYSLEPSARSRINAVYVGGLFAFFALGSLTATWVFASKGWTGVVMLCLGSCAAAALVHIPLSRRWRERLAQGPSAPYAQHPADTVHERAD